MLYFFNMIVIRPAGAGGREVWHGPVETAQLPLYFTSWCYHQPWRSLLAIFTRSFTGLSCTDCIFM